MNNEVGQPLVQSDALKLVTDKENEILAYMDSLGAHEEVDKRWLSIAKTDIEKGFMAFKRAIFSGKRVTDHKE